MARAWRGDRLPSEYRPNRTVSRAVVSSIGDANGWLSAFEGTCSVCGSDGIFEADELVRSLQRLVPASYACPTCGATLKYQGQADVLLRSYAAEGARSLAELVHEPGFRGLDVYEPGRLGPIRKYLAELPGYVRSHYRPGVDRGAVVDGVRCEDLMALSFASEQLDLVITTDVFEHVRHPYVAFAEVFRVLTERRHARVHRPVRVSAPEADRRARRRTR